MKLKIFMPMMLFALVLASFAAADARIKYQFFDQNGNPVDNVDAMVYLCNDATCSNVVLDAQGNSGTSGAVNDVTITYAANLPTQYGYAIYFLRDGYVPIEGTANWHGTGNVTLRKVFNKIANCHAAISEFSVINKVEPNIPLVINVAAQADANTYSAFNPAGIPPLYKPTGRNDLYSALTDVTLSIYDANNNLVKTEKKTLNLYMGTREAVQFSWTPTVEGDYRVQASTEVVDNQCSSQYSEFSYKNLEVLKERPTGMCYTLLNELSLSNQYPVVGSELTASVKKISNYADSMGSLAPVATKFTLTVLDANAQPFVLSQQDFNVNANADASTASPASVKWTPANPGNYILTLTASGLDSRCTVNKDESISQSFSVRSVAATKPNVYFNIFDEYFPSVGVSDVIISMNGKTGTTNNNGNTVLNDIDQGVQNYQAVNKYYADLSGSVNVGTTDVTVVKTMTPKYFTMQITVIDGTGNPVSGATIAASSVYGNLAPTTTDANGIIILNNVHAGMWSVSASKGSAASVPQNVDLDANKAVTLTINLNQQPTIVVTGIVCIPVIQVGKVQTCTVGVRDNFNNIVTGVGVRLYQASTNTLFGSAVADANGNAVISYPASAVGNFVVWAYAEYTGYIPDQDGAPTFSYTITPVAPGVNTLPVFNPVPTNKKIVLGETLSFTINAQDAEGDIIYYAASNLPSGASFDSVTRLFSWTPTGNSQLGDYKVTFKITDDPTFAQSNSQEITLSVVQPDKISAKEALDVQKMDVSSEDVVAGGQFTTTMTIGNDEAVDLDNVRIFVSIPELGVWSMAGPFQLESGEEATKVIQVDIPKKAKPGKYYVRYDLKDFKAKVQLTRDFIRVK